ncbi:LysR family transcriptional regulator [Kouleothrix sp.]|uniref:LysR family transcriptional regulator n=1 Tax=Kouleothrix sp. TaxID=2779161 RepID=UPI00391AE522
MDTEQLVMFERIAREGSFSRAAWALGVAQPTVSARVQALERAVGGQLFVRGSRGVALTDLGASFLPFARRALEVLDAGVAAAREAHAGQRGRVTLGVLESLSGAFLGPALAEFHAAHPLVEVVARAGRHEQLVELLLDGVIGMALLAWPCLDALTTDLEVLLALREPVVLVAAAQHPLAGLARADEDAIVAHARPLLLLRWWLALPPAIERLARRAPSVLDVPMETGRQLLESGVGAGFFSWMQVAGAVEAGRLAQIPVRGLAGLQRESALVRRASLPLSAPAAALAEVLRARAAQLGLLA